MFAAQSELLDRIRSVPQVVSAATTTKVPLDRSSWTMGFVLPASDDVDSFFSQTRGKREATPGRRAMLGHDPQDTIARRGTWSPGGALHHHREGRTPTWRSGRSWPSS